MKRNIIAIAIILALFGCNAEKKDYARTDKESMADTTATVELPAEKIIKTADMRFRVKDVQNTKEQLSKAIKAEGGTVAEFSIESSIQETDKVKQSTDSLKEITSYRTQGYLVAKVPSEKLDEFTNTIAKMAVFVDNQSMKMDDQSIAYLSNKLKAQNRVDAIEKINKVASKKSANVESSLYIKDDYVDKRIENMQIDSRVKFSTITLNFYQDNTVKTMIVANDNLYDYRPAFINRLWLGIVNGWTIFKEIIIAISNLWMLILVGIAIFFTIKYFVRKNKLAMAEATKNMIDQARQ
ncbi:hypothetical protein SRABI27_02284 [Pedobacter sp. Bi27]|uniref:DUF4349 domain-containing protein n=1 Tax=unclassified Pedobacter TaxID=2628915 RepID=UPI001DBF1DEB|nr:MULTISPECIES: DUF4349 domain-containing protein [unclassified Pedobacter]CAH0223369.1 hypothetical protein SRABI27_02284 [Pedobacter sp. Bi27]CAH0236579.1 hypothetical protein SRABI36_02857 [Pedobacter sp. Bi36]CAH0263065.1 hypothetical protein SRABI126_03257 [Pedobacter sp. Bi126]